MGSYNYTISTDTANASLSTDSLSFAITQSNIIPSLIKIDVLGDSFNIVFDTVLNTTELTTLTGLVNVHDGLALVQEEESINVQITNKNPETGGLLVTNKFSPDGWLQRLHEIEFTTSTVGGAIHDKDYENNDTGWSAVKFYEGTHGSETEITGTNATDQAYLDANCTRTDFCWMPDVDYMILSGVISHIDIPNDDVYMWGLFMDLDAAYGGPQLEILGGGMNMKYVASREKIGIRGVSGSTIYYDKIVQADGTEINLPPGSGSNRIRFIMRHPAGFTSRYQAIFEIFRA